MSWIDTLVLAMRSLRRRLTRAALTGLGVALGSGLLVALGTISSTADSNVISRLSHGGPADAIKVAAASPQPGQLDSDNLKASGVHAIDNKALTSVRRLPHVVSVVPVTTSEALAVPPDGNTYFGTIIGADLSRANDLPITVLQGRLPAPGSLTEVAVGGSYLDRLQVAQSRAATILGREVELAAPRREASGPVTFRGRWIRLKIVGVVAQQLADGDFLVPLRQAQLAREWGASGSPDPDFPLLTSPYSGLIVVASSLDDVHNVRAEITALGYATSAPEHLVASVQRYLRVVDIVLGGIGTVALGIAALDIASTLLAAVHERRREVGILKAIGARDKDVLRWFLLEAATIGLVGGIIGSLGGIGVAEVVGVVVNNYLLSQGLGGVDLGGIPVWILLGGVVGATAMALVAGGIPSMLAARLPAREAVAGE